jgi:hypothetical protein
MEVGWAVSTDNRNEAFLDRTPAQPGEETHAYRAVGFAASAALHGLALFVMLMVVQHGMQTARSGLLSVPVEIDRVTPDLKAGEKITLPPRQEPVPDASSQAQSGANGPSATAQLDAKLQTLSKLRQPDGATEPGTSASHASALDDDAMPGQQALYSVRDLIRAQVERRWNFDLASLGDDQFSVPIHVEITETGVVIKAEIVENARSADPVYRAIAASARNAVLLASPLALPPGQYRGTLDLVLNLDPRDALR